MMGHPRPMPALPSGGGHWVEPLRLAPAFVGCEVHDVTTGPESAQRAWDATRETGLQQPGFRSFSGASCWYLLCLFWQTIQLSFRLQRVRPNLIFTLGAAADDLAVRLGRPPDARRLWIDSVANNEELSMPGRRAGPRAQLWLTQSPARSRPEGPHGKGRVL